MIVDVYDGCPGWTGAARSLLPLLTDLQTLHIVDWFGLIAPAHDLSIFHCLPGLQMLILQLDVHDKWDADTICPLSRLSNLQSLTLEVLGVISTAMLLSASLSRLINLTHLYISCREPQHQDTENVASMLSHLRSLEVLRLDGVLEFIPSCVGTLLQLQSLQLLGFPEDTPTAPLPPSLWQCALLTRLLLGQLSDATVDQWASMSQSWQGLATLRILHIADTDVRNVLTGLGCFHRSSSPSPLRTGPCAECPRLCSSLLSSRLLSKRRMMRQMSRTPAPENG